MINPRLPSSNEVSATHNDSSETEDVNNLDLVFTQDETDNKKAPAKIKTNYIWSKLSGAVSLLLSPIFAVSHFISNLAHKSFFCFSSKLSTKTTQELDFGDNFINDTRDPTQDLTQEQKNDIQKALEADTIDTVNRKDTSDTVNRKDTSDTVNRKDTSKTSRTLVKIPALGNCLFIAIAVALKRQYADDRTVQSLLKWDFKPGEFPDNLDLSTNDFRTLLQEPAQQMRNLAATAIEKELNELKTNTDEISALETNQNDIEGKYEDNTAYRKLLNTSSLIRLLKVAIDGHNEKVVRLMREDLESYETNTRRIKMAMRSIFAEKDVSSNEKYMRSLRPAPKRNFDAFLTHKAQKINCSLEGFNRTEIPQMLKYVEKVIKKDGEYASYPEISSLSTLFNVPIRINVPIRDIENNLVEYRVDHIFNSHLDKPAINLVYDRNHFNLLLG